MVRDKEQGYLVYQFHCSRLNGFEGVREQRNVTDGQTDGQTGQPNSHI